MIPIYNVFVCAPWQNNSLIKILFRYILKQKEAAQTVGFGHQSEAGRAHDSVIIKEHTIERSAAGIEKKT